MQPQIRYVPRFYLKEKLTLTVNRFEVLESLPDGGVGKVMCFAEQKRFTLKEQVTFYADQNRTIPVFSFKARNVTDINGKYDVFDENGQQLAFFGKDWKASLWRSSFRVEGPGYLGIGQERNALFAIVRRIYDVPFIPIHFDFFDDKQAPLLHVERQTNIRDNYTVKVEDQRIDYRVAAALAVGLDVLLGR